MDEPTAGMAPKERVELMRLTAESPASARSRCFLPNMIWTLFSPMPTT